MVKKGAAVKILTGKDKGKIGKIMEVNYKKHAVKVEGVNLVTKHYKARRQGEKSMIKVFESFIDISNVALISAT